MTDGGARRLLPFAFLAAASVLLPAHSPYAQWYAYRAKHLVVVTDEARPGAFAAASSVAAALAERWPESKAVAAAARSAEEVVSLLRSGQLQVAILGAKDAADAIEGRGRFAASGKVPLRALAVVRGDPVVVLESYPAERARRIARCLSPQGVPEKPLRPPIPLHSAALEFYAANPR